MNLGTSNVFMRASVTATTGDPVASTSWSPAGILKSPMLPHCLRNESRACHPFANILPTRSFLKYSSMAGSSSHWPNTASWLNSIRDGEKIADPNVITVMNSAWIKPGTLSDRDGNRMALRAEMEDVFTRWYENTLMVEALSYHSGFE